MEHVKKQGGVYPPQSNRRINVHPCTPPYHVYAKGLYEGSACSVDMVRLNLTVHGSSGSLSADFARRHQWLHRLPTAPDSDGEALIRFWPCSSTRPGNWDTQYTYSMGESTITLGWGLYGSEGCDMTRAFVEFNPNKVAIVPEFRNWMKLLAPEVKRSRLARWDLAYDVPVGRELVRVRKDRRAYGAYLAKTYTEYLGQRSHAGYVKVYDKAAELGFIDEKLTRIEMTCDGEWGIDEIRDHWPDVYQIAACDESGLTSTLSVIAGLLADRARAGESIEPELKQLSRRTQYKLRKAIEDVTAFVFPADAVETCLGVAKDWAKTLGEG